MTVTPGQSSAINVCRMLEAEAETLRAVDPDVATFWDELAIGIRAEMDEQGAAIDADRETLIGVASMLNQAGATEGISQGTREYLNGSALLMCERFRLYPQEGDEAQD